MFEDMDQSQNPSGQQDQGAGGSPTPGDTGRPSQPSEQAIPYARFKEVNDQLRSLREQHSAYSQFGKVDELKQKLQQLEEYRSGGGKFTPKERETLRSEILDLFPEFNHMQQDREARQSAYISQAQGQVPKFLEEVGVDSKVNPHATAYLEELLAGAIALKAKQEPSVKQRFVAGDQSLIQETWKELKSLFWSGMQRKNLAAIQQIKNAAPKSVNGNGKAIEKKDPQNADEVRAELSALGDQAFAFLEASE